MPGKNPDPVATPQTAADWRTRRDRLRTLLNDTPDGAWSWLWQVQLDIVDYLIHRYADGHDLAAGAAAEVRARPANGRGHGDTPLSAEHGPWQPPNAARVMKAASLDGPATEHLREALRGRLSSLHTTNDDRRASEPPIPPAPVPKQYCRLTPEEYHALSCELRPLPIPVWLERVLLMPVKWPLRLADPDLRRTRSQTRPRSDVYEDWVRRMLYCGQADEAGVVTESTGVEPMDAESISLLRQAIADDQGWDLSADEPLSDEQIARLLNGDPEDSGIDADA